MGTMPVDVAMFVLLIICCSLPSALAFFAGLSVLKYVAREFTMLFEVFVLEDTKSPKFSDTRLTCALAVGIIPAAICAASKTFASGLFKP